MSKQVARFIGGPLDGHLKWVREKDDFLKVNEPLKVVLDRTPADPLPLPDFMFEEHVYKRFTLTATCFVFYHTSTLSEMDVIRRLVDNYRRPTATDETATPSDSRSDEKETRLDLRKSKKSTMGR